MDFFPTFSLFHYNAKHSVDQCSGVQNWTFLLLFITVTKYLVRLGGGRSWPQGFVPKKGVNTYNVGRELFKVWTANSDMKNS